MKGTALAAIIFAAVVLASLVLDPALGAVLVVIALIGCAFYFSRPKCAKCGRRGTILPNGTVVTNRMPGFGLVTRTDTVTDRGQSSDGTTTTSVKEVHRQERVPTVTVTTRHLYKCTACGNETFKDVVSQTEDFTRSGQEPVQPTVIQKETVKEVLRVPCKYCGTLLDPISDRRCPSCGSPVKV